MKITINNKELNLDVNPEMPLLWALRDELKLKGTKFGCGMSLCGACTVVMDGIAMRSCTLRVQDVSGAIQTIESAEQDEVLKIIQKAWVENQVAQCGYCQPGQIMNASSLLKQNNNPSDDDIDGAMSGNICRCGTYPKIRKAIKDAASNIRKASK